MKKKKKKKATRSSPKPSAPKPFPPFDLAPLEGIDPAAFDTTTSIGRLVLVLALVFNDIKGLIVFQQVLGGTARLETEEATASRGQYAGLTLQIARFIGGIVHELMVELTESDARAATASSEFARLLGTLRPQARQAWNLISGVALGDDPSTGQNDLDRQMLLRLRNDVGFHYSSKILSRGYRRHFSSKEKLHTSCAAFSDGKTMEATRFYFADAAAEEAIYEATKIETRDVAGRIGALAALVNLALKPIVMAYLKSVATPAPCLDQ